MLVACCSALASLCFGTVGAVASTGGSSGRDQTSTARFVAAVDAFYRAELHDVGRVRTAQNAFISGISSGCHGTLPATDSQLTVAQGQVYVTVLTEAGADLELQSVPARAAALRAQDRVFQHLRWSRSSIRRALAAQVRADRSLIAIAPSDLCADVKAATTSKYATLAPATTRLIDSLDRLNSINVDSLQQLLTLMKPYTAPTERSAIKRLESLQSKVAHDLQVLNSASASRLAAALTT